MWFAISIYRSIEQNLRREKGGDYLRLHWFGYTDLGEGGMRGESMVIVQ